jgi:hypothetical protein
MTQLQNKKNNEITTTVSDNPSYNFGELKKLAKVVIESGLSPLDSENAVIMAVLQGKELGIPPMASVNNIFDINGKATPSIHLMNALALKNKVTHKILVDYEPKYKYLDGNKVPYPEELVLKKVDNDEWSLLDSEYLQNKEVLASLPKDKKCIIRYLVDRFTTVEGVRTFKDGRTMTAKATYKYSTAQNSGLIKNSGAWVKDPQNQMHVRALSKLFRLLGDDFLLGLHYEATEMMDAEGIDYDLDGDSDPVIIKEEKS